LGIEELDSKGKFVNILRGLVHVTPVEQAKSTPLSRKILKGRNCLQADFVFNTARAKQQ
jgi:hypothetical protein